MDVKRGIYALSFLAGACIFAVILFVCIMFPQNNQPPALQIPALHTSGWNITCNGSSSPAKLGETIPAKDGIVTITKTIEPNSLDSGDTLLFYNNRQSVTVEAEGRTLYEVGNPNAHTKLNVACYCVAQLPKHDYAYNVDITFRNDNDVSCQLPNIALIPANDVFVLLVQTDVFTLANIPIWAVIAIGLIVISALMKRAGRVDWRIVCVAFFLFCSVGWSFDDTVILSLLPINPELSSIMGYYFLMALPIPLLYFIHWSCINRNNAITHLCISAALINIAAQSILFFCGAANFNQMLPITHCLILMSLVIGLIRFVSDYRQTPTSAGKIQVVAFAIIIALGICAIALYWLQIGLSYRTFLQLIVVVVLAMMIAIVAYSQFQQSLSKTRRAAEAETYERFSAIDALTGLANRRTFEDDLQKAWISDEKAINKQLAFFDLNGLKYTNDNYGRMSGDELIVAAAKIIEEAFASLGKSYRIGGDEFAVIISGAVDSAVYGQSLMDGLIKRYNEEHDVPLSVAHGICPLLDSLGEKRSLNDWKMCAIMSMYRNKIHSRATVVRGSEEDYREIITSFASAVDAKDTYTANHSNRVGTISDIICGMLGLSESSTSQIYTAARLHDIGKIGIPDSILSKPGSLTEPEFSIMKNHSSIGEDILKHTRAFYEVSKLIRHHHERYDGNGYPDGLTGDTIPLGARIIAIADSIDAMTSDRSYRKALSPEYCRSEIERGLGTLYDPAIGSIVLQNWEELEKTICEHSYDSENVG